MAAHGLAELVLCGAEKALELDQVRIGGRRLPRPGGHRVYAVLIDTELPVGVADPRVVSHSRRRREGSDRLAILTRFELTEQGSERRTIGLELGPLGID